MSRPSDNIDWTLIKVLVVDDDETVHKLMAKLFDIIGCVGAYVKDGKDAIEMARRYRFDLCFMDLLMPEMGGVEAAQIIHEEIDPQLPMVALTSHAMQANREKCLDVGMQDYITKPVSFETIKKIIGTYGVRSPLAPPNHIKN